MGTLNNSEFSIQKLPTPGVLIYSPTVRADHRGSFVRHYAREAIALPDELEIVHANISRTSKAGTFRGLHYQVPPFAEYKLVSCLAGEILDVFVDVRPDSPTFLQSETVVLSESSNTALLIPPGIANGMFTLSQNTLVHYYSTAPYSPGHESGFRFDDPVIDIKLPFQPNLISQKDLSWENLRTVDFEVFRGCPLP